MLRTEIFDLKRGRGNIQVTPLDYPSSVVRGQRNARSEIAAECFAEVKKRRRAVEPHAWRAD